MFEQILQEDIVDMAFKFTEENQLPRDMDKKVRLASSVLVRSVPSSAISLVELTSPSKRSRSTAYSDNLDEQNTRKVLKTSRSQVCRNESHLDLIEQLRNLKVPTSSIAIISDDRDSQCQAACSGGWTPNSPKHDERSRAQRQALSLLDKKPYWTAQAIEQWAVPFDRICQYCHGVLYNISRSIIQSPFCRDCIFDEFLDVLSKLETQESCSKKRSKHIPPWLQLRNKNIMTIKQRAKAALKELE